MAGSLGSPNDQFSGPPYLHPFRPASSMSANRFDEGYSEDTRSQNEGDMLMRSEVRLADGDMEADSPFVLPDWVMALSENERSGTYISRQHHIRADMTYRIRLRHPALAADLLDSRHRRKAQPAPPP
jgi:hypothetical protein